jgi:hypothetical protein
MGVATAAAHAGMEWEDLAPLCSLVGVTQDAVELLGSGLDLPLPPDAIITTVPPEGLAETLAAGDAIAAATRPIAAALEEDDPAALATVHVRAAGPEWAGGGREREGSDVCRVSDAQRPNAVGWRA